MNTLTKMFSLCLCLGALVFAVQDAKLSENNLNPISLSSSLDLEKNNLERGPSLDYEPSSRDCGETFVAFGSDPEGYYGVCWDDGSGYFYFYWEGGCLALDVTYSGGTLDLSTYGFTEGFFFYGFDAGATEDFIINFDDGSAGASTATSDCVAECGDGACNGDETYETCPQDCDESGCGTGEILDCVDDDCCPESWIGDGFPDCEDQQWGCDLTCYDNDGGDCDEGTTDGGTDGGTASCEDCVYDWTAYGSECCDTAWDEYGIDCATLESTYGWDCEGCSCPGDNGGTDGGGNDECTEDFCPDGTYWDGFSCYDCSYCLDVADDSACDDPYDCCGMCGGSFDGGCTNCEDEGLVTCWDGSCAASEADCPDTPDVETPGICAEGTVLYDAPAVMVTWTIVTECGDGVCNGDEDYYNCPEDCNAPGECDDGFLADCDGSGECWPESWCGDGFPDCEDQQWGADLTCYDNDCGDCDEGGTTGGTDGGTSSCDDCEFDWTPYGSECCDTAWDEFGIDCATLESTYGWDCAGCSCPGDGEAECGDGNCNGDEDYYSCPEDCNAPGECDDGFLPDCVDDSECWVDTWIGDGFCDGTAEEWGANLCCYDLDGGDCTEAECAEGRDTAADGPASIKDVAKNLTKKDSYRPPTASAPIHGPFDNTSSRDVVLTLTFSCDACLSGGPWEGAWAVEYPGFGEFTVYGFDDASFVTITAEACEGAACGGVVGPVGAIAGAGDGEQDCTEGAGGDPCDGTLAGDATLDGDVNVLDIVQIVNHILESALLTDECALGAADYTDDGDVNVLDIVQIVNVILDGRITGDATSATLKNENGQMTIDANGYIGGVQMTLSHGPDFSIEVTDKALVADYNTMGNTTKLVIVVPETDELFSSVGNYTIDEMIVANSTSEVSVSMPSNIEIVGAYPNPFNPSTTVSISVDNATAATIMAYDISGRVVGVVFDGVLDAGMSSVTWNASSLPSGAYILKLSTPDGSASMQKVMLMK